MKILILHASAGAGHRRAAEALEAAFRIACPSGKIVSEDILQFTPAAFRRTYAKGYLRLVRSAPKLWGYLYSHTDRKSQMPHRRRIRAFFNKLNTRAFCRFLDDLQPDAVVCTHFLPLEVVGTMIKDQKTSVPLFCAITDFAVHALWLTQNVTRYFVATQEAQRYLARHGQSEHGTRVTGIPIHPNFARKTPAEEAREKLGLERDRPAILLLSGGFGVGPTVDLIRSLRHGVQGCQLMVVAGRNPKLRKRCETATAELPIPSKVFGFVGNIDELMDACDLVITKPGGLSVSESLAKTLPLLLIDPIPGQEQRNCDYLLEEGAALRLHDINDTPFHINQLLGDTSRMTRIRDNIRRVATPNAAVEIAEDVLATV